MATLSPEKAIEAVRRYREKGYVVFPVPVGQKKPDRERGWQKIAAEVTDDNVEELWKNGENIGCILAPPLTDIDLDSVEAINVAPYFFPNTPFKFGRANLPGLSHWVYLCEGIENKTYVDPIAQEQRREGRDVKAMLIEIRTGDMYTVFPPSVHPSGYQIKFAPNGGWPEAVLPPDLRMRVDGAAATSLMVRYWPGPGARNEATMALCGGLVRAEKEDRISPDLVDIIVRAIVELGGNSDPVSDYNALERTRKTFGKIDAGADKKVKGWATLEKLMGGVGKLAVRTFRDWLGILPKRRTRDASPVEGAPWADQLIIEIGTRGERNVARLPENVAVILRNDAAFHEGGGGGEPPDEEGGGGKSPSTLLYFDEFRRCKMVSGEMPWDHTRNWHREYPRQWVDADITEFQGYLARQWGVMMGKETVADGVDMHAAREHRHEIREYLESLVWDKHPRLDNMGPRYFSTQDTSYVRAAIRFWMIACVARIMDPGCQADNAIILEGPQGLGKSTALRKLAVKRDWFTDNTVDMHSKAGTETIVGAWIVELGELSSMRRADVETVKEFITRRIDKYRPPYARETITVPRSCLFAGTVNPGYDGYLKDATGNRRFWPIPCGPEIRLELLDEDRDQLWAEARDCYNMGERWYVTHADAEVMDEFVRQQRIRRERGEFEDQLLGWLQKKMNESKHPWFEFTMAEAMHEGLGYSAKEMNERYRSIEMGRTLGKLNIDKTKRGLYRLVTHLENGAQDVRLIRSHCYRVTSEQLIELIDDDIELKDDVDRGKGQRTLADGPVDPNTDDEIPF